MTPIGNTVTDQVQLMRNYLNGATKYKKLVLKGIIHMQNALYFTQSTEKNCNNQSITKKTNFFR